ncbi:MAG TPA: NAD(+) synthase, partial [Phycisphaerae bacterium]|nr:NAD(+) synthase [Phycisphaerae bacterium]
TTPGLAEENMQARIRGNILMALSNKFGHLLLTTGNKSEVATGYCTLYGDMAGGLAVISDVPKTMVYQLARWINRQAVEEGKNLPIPENSLTKPPSAELKPNQTDQDTLPPYEVLDAILQRYVEEEKPVQEIIKDGFDRQTVLRVARMVDTNEYKRKQMPPGLKVTSRAFGYGRRMPIAQRHDPIGNVK